MPEIIQKITNVFWPWLTTQGVKIAIILIVALVLRRFSSKLIERLVRKIIVSNHFLSKEAEEKRENTIIKIFDNTLRVSIWVIAGMMIFSAADVSIGPLLAAAGVAGLAFGFGGQYLIRDVISGLFIILENQYRVGDVVCLNSTCGLVEDITLRLTILRDLDGTVHHVPNGEIKIASNLSKYFARINLNVGIAYNSNLEKVIEVVNKVGRELAQDPQWKELIVKAPQFLRVDDFADSAIIIKILGETKPLKQWDATGELRKRLKIAFDKEGIEIPFPQRVVHQA
ncbi:mechanosensitive ion channel family protein [Patescibacteria group bacterium]|nr:mechanosensitive ion channel family protein [Patescibacteria group bacterium]MBU4143008.1 mechanosensitive ion channel family protein [Patescibacteria group bacterium]